MLKAKTSALIACLLLVAACARVSSNLVSLPAPTDAELRRYLVEREPNVDRFRTTGPFEVTVEKDYQLRLPNKVEVEADLFLSGLTDKAPLVIFLHGYDSSKEDHGSQAMHLASWGMHCLTLQLPARSHWARNGKTLAMIAKWIHDAPEIIDRRVDANKILLVGHSFGGSSVAIALGEGAPAAGAILLDPAGIGKELPSYLHRIKTPVMVLGADTRLGVTRNRQFFYRFIPHDVAEISISGATHEDGQYPAVTAKISYGATTATEEMQTAFVAALTSAAFSIEASGSLDYAWASYDHEVKAGRFFDARRK
jgi:pimeloyl-ACP methyl ester carboxylesterase